MTREEFLLELDDVLEMPAGSLKGPERLDEIEQWNSTALIGFFALADMHNGVRLSARQVAQCSTVEDLLNLAQVAPGPA